MLIRAVPHVPALFNVLNQLDMVEDDSMFESIVGGAHGEVVVSCSE